MMTTQQESLTHNHSFGILASEKKQVPIFFNQKNEKCQKISKQGKVI